MAAFAQSDPGDVTPNMNLDNTGPGATEVDRACAILPGKRYGDGLPLAQTQYHKGETVVAEFWSANPTAHYTTGDNFVLVEHRTAAGWQAIADDGDWGTRVRWRLEDGSYIAQLS